MLHKNLFQCFLFLTIVSIALACNKDEEEEDTRSSDEKIQEYLKTNNIEAIKDTSGLYYLIEEPGSGELMSTSDSWVKVYYKGYLTNGVVFDSKLSEPASFKLNTLVKGWQYGLPLFPKGSSGKLFIPSELAYGESGSGSIPANAVLIFEIKMVNFW